MKTYKVIKNRESESLNPIVLKVDEKVICLEVSNSNGEWPNWVFCKTESHEGWVPNQIINKINAEEGIILEAYDAREFDLKVGEVLKTSKELNGWVWGQKMNSNENAWAPLNHLELVR